MAMAAPIQDDYELGAEDAMAIDAAKFEEKIENDDEAPTMVGDRAVYSDDEDAESLKLQAATLKGDDAPTETGSGGGGSNDAPTESGGGSLKADEEAEPPTLKGDDAHPTASTSEEPHPVHLEPGALPHPVDEHGKPVEFLEESESALGDSAFEEDEPSEASLDAKEMAMEQGNDLIGHSIESGATNEIDEDHAQIEDMENEPPMDPEAWKGESETATMRTPGNPGDDGSAQDSDPNQQDQTGGGDPFNQGGVNGGGEELESFLQLGESEEAMTPKEYELGAEDLMAIDAAKFEEKIENDDEAPTMVGDRAVYSDDEDAESLKLQSGQFESDTSQLPQEPTSDGSEIPQLKDPFSLPTSEEQAKSDDENKIPDIV
jgi:hypothetical protein